MNVQNVIKSTFLHEHLLVSSVLYTTVSLTMGTDPNLTLITSKTTMEHIPRTKSCHLVSPMFSNSLLKASITVSLEYDRPNSPFSCEAAMEIAAAEVKPAMTGLDMKVMRNPETPKTSYY